MHYTNSHLRYYITQHRETDKRADILTYQMPLFITTLSCTAKNHPQAASVGAICPAYQPLPLTATRRAQLDHVRCAKSRQRVTSHSLGLQAIHHINER